MLDDRMNAAAPFDPSEVHRKVEGSAPLVIALSSFLALSAGTKSSERIGFPCHLAPARMAIVTSAPCASQWSWWCAGGMASCSKAGGVTPSFATMAMMTAPSTISIKALRRNRRSTCRAGARVASGTSLGVSRNLLIAATATMAKKRATFAASSLP
jgi:hypothetical protein